jgi:hypothetical protein
VTLPYKYFLACFYKSRTSYFRHLYKNIWSAEIRKQFRSDYPEIYETFKNDLAKLYLIKSPVSRHEEYLELEEIKSDYINFWNDDEHNLRGLFRNENPDVYDLLLKSLPEDLKDPEPYSGHVVLNEEVMNIDDLVRSKQIRGDKNE